MRGREGVGRVQKSSEKGYRLRCVSWWLLKWVMKVGLESCGVCSYTTELNNRGAQQLSC